MMKTEDYGLKATVKEAGPFLAIVEVLFLLPIMHIMGMAKVSPQKPSREDGFWNAGKMFIAPIF